MDGVRPSSATAPSIWYAEVATPHRKDGGQARDRLGLGGGPERIVVVGIHGSPVACRDDGRAQARPALAGCSQQATVRLAPSGVPADAQHRDAARRTGRTPSGSAGGTSSRSACRAGPAVSRGCRSARGAGRAAPGRSAAAPRCTGAASPGTASAAGASSTIRPPYMIAIRSENSTSSDRSWVMNRTEKPSRSRSSTSWPQDLPLHHHVERGGRLVHDDDLRLAAPAPCRSSRAGACRRRAGAGSCPAGRPRCRPA